MSSTKHQQLLSLKEENLKFKENFDKFLKKHEANKKYISIEQLRCSLQNAVKMLMSHLENY